jgi:putative DNA-binding protein
MKRSRPISSSRSLKTPRLEVRSRTELKALQSLMATAVFRPLTAQDGMQRRWIDGRKMSDLASTFIKPNDRLPSFDRLEIYNRVYWFRVLDCLYDDYPGLRAVLGQRKFMKLITAYLARYPSASFTLRNLGSRLEQFLRDEPCWIAPRPGLALDMARFEWAQIVAFDDESKPAITPDDILDARPDRLRLGLQPYLSLLELNYEVDEFLLAVKKSEAAVLRSEASNTFEAMPHASGRERRIRLPKRKRIYLAVHRHDNMLYYKRLDPEGFVVLTALREGASVEEACLRGLSSTKRTGIDWTEEIRASFDNWASLGWFCRCSKK